MSANIVQSSGGGGLARASSVSVGEGNSTEGLKFEGRAELYSDLPTSFRVGASSSNAIVLKTEAEKRQGGTSIVLAGTQNLKPPVHIPATVADSAIASGVRKLSKNFKRGERIVQRKLGWFAMPNYIYVTTVERELQWRDDKKLAPSGPWLIENRRKWVPTQGVADKRVGSVRATPDTYEEGSSSRYVEEAEVIPDAFLNGASAMGYLPKQVRGDVVVQVPTPNYFDGRLLGFTNQKTGAVDRLEVSLLRMNDNVAIVIYATSDPSTDIWEVTQARYLLSTPEVESA